MERLVRRRSAEVKSDIQLANSLDAIADPLALGFSLSCLQTEVEDYAYSKYCRVSKLSGLCVRQQILGWRHDVLGKSKISVGSKMIYDKGNAYHKWMQNDPAYFGDRRRGWWKCLSCDNKRFGAPPKVGCTNCGALIGAIVYDEHEMLIEHPYYVSGHPDMLLALSDNDVRVTELKSMKGEDFDRLKAPLADNVYQLHGYMEYLQYDKKLPIKINPNRGLLIYITKRDGTPKFPLKAFHVVRNNSVIEAITTDLAEHKKARDDTSYVPPANDSCVQSDWSSSRARWCDCKDICKEIEKNVIST